MFYIYIYKVGDKASIDVCLFYLVIYLCYSVSERQAVCDL